MKKIVIELPQDKIKILGNTDRQVSKVDVYQLIDGEKILDGEFRFNDGADTEMAINLVKKLLRDLQIAYSVKNLN